MPKKKPSRSTGRKKTKSAELSIREMGESLARIEALVSQTHDAVRALGTIRFLPSGVALTNAVQQILQKVQQL